MTEGSPLTLLAGNLVLDAVVQRLDQLLKGRVERRQVFGWPQKQATGSGKLPWLHVPALMLCAGENIPVRIYALIVPQVIQIDNQPDLLVVQHSPDGLAVVVLGIGLSLSATCEPSGWPAHKQSCTRHVRARD